MTKQTRKPASQFRGLKYWFAAGSLAAALLGAQLLAANDQLDTAVALSTTTQQEANVFPDQRQVQGPSGTTRFMSRQIELAPIPDVARADVRTVVRSRSSR